MRRLTIAELIGILETVRSAGFGTDLEVDFGLARRFGKPGGDLIQQFTGGTPAKIRIELHGKPEDLNSAWEVAFAAWF